MTGYERLENKDYFYIDIFGGVITSKEQCTVNDYWLYDVANYYSNKTVAENNARADRLMRKLRRFAVEHNEGEPNWYNFGLNKYSINYDYSFKNLYVAKPMYIRDFGQVYFTSKSIAEQAIEEFRNELLWYFKEYCDFVDGNKIEEKKYGCKLCNGHNLNNVGISENRIAVWGGNSKPDKEQKLKFCPNCGRRLED